MLDALSFPIGYQLVLVAAFLSSVVEVRTLMRMREPEASRSGVAEGASRADGEGSVRMPRSYIAYCLVNGLFYLGWTMGAPLFTLLCALCRSMWWAFNAISGCSASGFPILEPPGQTARKVLELAATAEWR